LAASITGNTIVSKIEIDGGIYLDEIKQSDKPRYLELFKVRQIYEQTLAIPFPYTESDADWWINENQKKLERLGQPTSFAIRDSEGLLIGGAGFDSLEIGKEHKSELGYWLGKPYWKKGIMTKVVKKLCAVAFDEFELVRITANIFSFNEVLKKFCRSVDLNWKVI